MYHCTRPFDVFMNPCWRASSDKFHGQGQEFELPKIRRVSRLTVTARLHTLLCIEACTYLTSIGQHRSITGGRQHCAVRRIAE